MQSYHVLPFRIILQCMALSKLITGNQIKFVTVASTKLWIYWDILLWNITSHFCIDQKCWRIERLNFSHKTGKSSDQIKTFSMQLSGLQISEWSKEGNLAFLFRRVLGTRDKNTHCFLLEIVLNDLLAFTWEICKGRNRFCLSVFSKCKCKFWAYLEVYGLSMFGWIFKRTAKQCKPGTVSAIPVGPNIVSQCWGEESGRILKKLNHFFIF